MTPEDLEVLKDFTSPDALISSEALIVYALICAFFLIGILAASIKVIYQSTVKNRLKKRLEPFDKALFQLQTLKNSSPDTKTAAIQSSFIFREMLDEKVGDKALFETNEEFSLRPEALSSLPSVLREEVRHYLQKLAALKYVPRESPEEASQIIDDAVTLIKKLMERIESDERNKARKVNLSPS